MLRLEGKVLSVIRHDTRTDKQGKTYEGYSQVQLQVEELLDNDQLRYGIHTLTTAVPDAFDKFMGQMISVPVRAYVKAGSLALTMPQTQLPSLVSSHAAVPIGAKAAA